MVAVNRRQFLQAAIAVPLAAAAAPLLPSLAPASHVFTYRGIPWRTDPLLYPRFVYGRVTLSREALIGGLAGGGKTNAFARAIDEELQGLVDDLDPPRGQTCMWRSLERGRGFAGYLAREAEALSC